MTKADHDGYWSYVGNDLKQIPNNSPTMMLDSFSNDTPEEEFVRVVRHETGHTLGFPHEHMRPELVNRLDYEKTVEYFARTQRWNETTTVQQVLQPIRASALIGTADADPLSIMCYPLPAEITKDGQPIPGGDDIDNIDKKFANQMYPK